MAQLWVGHLNARQLFLGNEEFFAMSRTHTAHQVFLYRCCGKHVVYLTPKSLTNSFQNSGSALDCKVCKLYMTRTRAPTESALEERVYETVANYFLPDRWVSDACCVKTSKSSADVWVPALKLIIMVDGEFHFKDHFKTTAEAQKDIDKRFNSAAVQQGMTVLRLHHRDITVWPDFIDRVVHDCKSSTATASVVFTKSYHLYHSNWIKCHFPNLL